MSAFIEERRSDFGVEPICRALGVSASAYYERRSGRRSARAVEDERLLAEIERVHAGAYHAYGSRRVWKELRRCGESVARCTVERLMRENGIQGAKRRGKPLRTTTPDPEGQPSQTWSSATSAPSGPTSCGSPTSPTFAPGRAWSSSAS